MVLSDTDTQAAEYPAIVNSFAQLRFFAWAEKIIFEGSEEVGKAKRQKAKDEMRKNLFEVRRSVVSCAPQHGIDTRLGGEAGVRLFR